VSLHDIDGNLGHLVQPIATALKGVAQKCNCCIEIVAHSKKVDPRRGLTDQDMSSSMAFVNKTRHARVLDPMTKAQAKRYGIPEHEAGDYFRVTAAKHTHLASSKPVWRRKVGVGLGNGVDPDSWDDAGGGYLPGAHGETVTGVVTAWTPLDECGQVEFLADLSEDQLGAILRAVEGGLDRKDARAACWGGEGCG
jgi:hypothetical protein